MCKPKIIFLPLYHYFFKLLICFSKSLFQIAHDHTQELLDNLVATGEYTESNTIIRNEISQTDIDDFTCEKAKQLLHFDDAPEYLKHNNYIITGYRGMLNTKLCVERWKLKWQLWVWMLNWCVFSIFWWTNETINIWSHLFGLLLFSGLTVYDFILLQVHVAVSDKLIVGAVLVCFQVRN